MLPLDEWYAQGVITDITEYTDVENIDVDVNKFLNKITGRTKKLKTALNIEREKNILTHIKEVVGSKLFQQEELSEHLIPEFYFFCTDDPNFKQRCTNRSDIQILQFLQEKLKEFKANNLSEN